MNYKIPEKIKKHISDRKYNIETIGQSGSELVCFDDAVLKISEQDNESYSEYLMMKWLSDRLPVPEVIEFEQLDGHNFLLMSRLQGEMLCAQEQLNNPSDLLDYLCDGLKMLWSVDVSGCPVDCSVENKLMLARDRVINGLCSMEDAEPETYGENGFANPCELLEWLKSNKPEEEPVLSHGDYCLPNIFVNDNKISGFLDLGRCGTADKYQDIALCYRSLKHNFSGKFGTIPIDYDCNAFFEKLGIEPDWNKIRYYILLDELF